MKDVIRFLLFLVYVTSIFILESNAFILIFAIINLILMLVLKTSIKQVFRSMKGFLIIIAFTALANSIAIDWSFGIKIGIKLVLVCNATCIFSQVITYMQLAQIIEKIFYPIKWFGKNPKEMSLMVCIALSFIPILKDEIHQIKDSLKAKGFKLNLRNYKLIFKPFFISLLKRVNDIESSLQSKAYQN